MAKTVDFYFDFVSPTSYLAWQALQPIAAKAGAEIIYKPIFLGAIMQATGNRPPGTVAPKGAYMTRDLERHAAKYGATITWNPHFPFRSLDVLRGAHAYRDDPAFPAYVKAAFTAAWQRGENLGEAAVYEAIAEAVGIDLDAFRAAIASDAAKESLTQLTEEAIARGCFGAPTLFIGEAMFFGQDRMHFVAEALGIRLTDVFPDFLGGA